MTKRKSNILLSSVAATSLILSLIFSLNVHAYNLYYWYSNVNTIGYFTSPSIHYQKLNNTSNMPLAAVVSNSKNLWSAALSISIGISASSSGTNMAFYGGTLSELNALGIFGTMGITTLGMTKYTKTYKGEHLYGSMNVVWYDHTNVKCCIVKTENGEGNSAYYYKSGAHELGHALGWEGHPSGNHPNWIMAQGSYTTSSLSYEEKLHLQQVY